MDTQPLFTKQKITKTLSLKPNFINTKIDESIISILNRTIGGRCSSEGYIKRNSIKIHNKSVGQINLGDASGNIIYNISFIADICRPVEGCVYTCTIDSKNKMGIIAYSEEDKARPLYILIPRDYIGDEYNFDDLDKDDKINIRVIGVRFKHNDSIIQVVGEIMSKE
jgi:DNA-directed RNA polymerase subunit E'/Rpb7